MRLCVNERRKRILAACLSLVMALSLLPAPVLATETEQGQDELSEGQTLTLPVIEEGEEGPAPQGAAGSVSLMDLKPNEASDYFYAGQTRMYYSHQTFILDPNTGERVTSKPTTNGIVQMLDGEGTVVAASNAVSNYYEENDYSSSYPYPLLGYYFSSATFQDTGTVPAGTYSLQLYAGNTYYPLEGSVVVVDSDSLLIDRASIYHMYPGVASFDLRIQLYGFETEAELDDLTFQLLDGEGAVVAASSSQYRDFRIYESDGVTEWYLYTQMVVAEDRPLQSDVDYSLQIGYTGSKTLYDGVGAVTRSTSSPRIKVTAFDVLDAQTGLIQLTLAYWEEGTSYTVYVHNGYNENKPVVGQYSGVIESDTLTIQLGMNGISVPLSEYESDFYVEIYEEGYTFSDSFQNPYYNIQSDGRVSFAPRYISTSATSVHFVLEYWNGLSAYLGEDDILTLQDKNSTEVGRCENVERTENNGSSGTLEGTLTLSGLTAGRLYPYLNGVELDAYIYAAADLRCSSSLPMVDYDEAVFYTNLGEFKAQIDAVNSNGTGYFVFKTADALGDVLVSDPVTGVPSDAGDGLLRYDFTFSREELLAALSEDTAYAFYFRDGTGAEKDISCSENGATLYTTVGELDLTDTSQFYAYWYDASVGSNTVSAAFRFYSGSVRNIPVSELDKVTKLTLTNSTDTTSYAVTGYTNGAWGEYANRYEVDLVLNAPLTAGSYTVFYDGTQIDTFTIRAPSTEDTAPRLYNNEYSADQGFVQGQNLPADSTYTARLYSGYTCLTEDAFALTYDASSDGYYQYLRYPSSVVKDLETGKYELRVYMDGKVLGSATLVVADLSQPVVRLRDAYDYRYSRLNLSGTYIFEVGNAGIYVKLRAAESQEDLADAAYYPINDTMLYRLSEGEGEKMVYVQLCNADETKESEVMTFRLWRMASDDDTLEIFVPEDIQGVYSGSSITLAIGAECQYADAFVELQDSSGSTGEIQMDYQGFGPLPALYPDAVHGLESAHNYSDNMDQTWSYTLDGAASLEVTFSGETYTEPRYDYIYIYSGSVADDNLVGKYSGSDLADKTVTVPGDTVVIRLTSDGSNTCYGFAVTSVVDPNAPETPEDTTNYKHIYSVTLNTSDYYNGVYLRDNEFVTFYLKDEAEEIVSESVQRLLIFGRPDAVILPQFQNSYSTVWFNTSDVTLYGYATPNSTVMFTEGETTLATVTANAYGRFEATLTGLEDGSHSVVVADSNTAVSATTASFRVDTVVPVIESINFTFGDGNDATIRWVCNDSDIDYFRIFKNDVLLGSNVSSSSRTYSVAAAMDDGNFFTIQAYDKAGNMGEKTVSTADQEPPTAPETLNVTGVTTTTATLEWSAGTDNIGILGYDVYMDGAEVARLTGADTLTYTVTGLEQGKTYTFTVKTRDKAGNTSDASPAATVSTVKLTVGDSSLADSYIVDEFASSKYIPVSFTVTADREGYNVSLRSAAIEFRPTTQDNTGAWESASLTGFSGGDVSGYWPISGSGEDGYLPMGEYDVRFTVTDSYGAVAASGTTKVVLLKRDDVAPTTPGTPTAVSHSTTAITFQWAASTDNVGVDHYEVFRNGTKIAEPKTTSYTDEGLEMGRSYSYTVKAVDARGNTSAPSAASLSTMTLAFESVIDFDDAYVLEEQPDKLISVWAKFNPEEGYVPDVTMTVEYKAEDAETWISAPLTVSADDANLFEGTWSVAGDELGYLPVGIYRVRFAVTDGSATAYSDSQTVALQGETEAPVVSSLSPDGAVLSGKAIELTAQATDNVRVTRIVFSYAVSGSESFTQITAVETTDQAEYTWDASALQSGVYTIKAEAYDARGNVGEKTISLTIDNTPPVTPEDFTVTPTSRYIHVMWDTSYDRPADFAAFHVYRATSADGPYTEMFSRASVGYYDDGETAEAGVTYYYYVTATDVRGNESAPTAILSATFVNDNESPEIGDMLPRAGESLRKETTLRVTASDNYRLSTAIFSYRAQGSDEWIEIGRDVVDQITNNTVFSLDWKIPASLTKGTYEIKAEVYDASYTDLDSDSGYTPNAPAVIIRTVTIYPYSAPVAPVVTATAGYKTAKLSWTYSGDTATLRQFTVYQTDAAGGSREYVTAVKTGTSGSCDVTIPANGTQYFVVVAQDTYGVTAASSVISVTSLPGESEPPVAVIQPETLTAAVGIPFTFSGVNSTDNDVIASYAWNFGDGQTGSGAECQHTYTAEGTYTVKLTVTDESGNSNTAAAAMTVYDISGEDATHALMTLHVVNAYVEGTPGIAGADVKIYTADGSFESGGKTDESGVLTVVAPVGAVTVAATADGFIATSRAVTVEREESGTFSYTVGMTPMNVSLVDGSLTVTEMTYDEILAAGIDVTNPDNNHVWKFAATLEFVAGPAFPYDLPALPIEGYFNGSGTFLGGFGWGWTFFGLGGGSGGGGWGGMNVGVFPISEHFVLVIYGEAHWLKEMYNVELLVINNSYVDDITDCEATLTLPEGLSLAAMTGAAQTATIDLGTISHKTSESGTANTTKANWYVRGDAEGEYYLTATVTGNNPDPFVKEFTTDKPVKVYAGSALKLFITAEDVAYRGKEYHVQFKLQNVSDKSLYNLSFGITGAEQFRVVEMGGTTEQTELTHEDFGSSMTRSVKELLPGGSITIDFYTTTWFNSLLELADLGPFDVGYYLTNVFVTTLEGSTTTIPYEVNIVHAPHGSFYEWLWEQTKDGAVDFVTDLIDDTVFYGIPVTGTMSKAYEVKVDSEGAGDAASHATITIENGRFISSENVLTVYGLDESAIVVYTDAPEDSYTISADGKTMTLNTSAKVYVEGAADGVGTMTVTTYTYNSATEKYDPNVYKLQYTVDMAGGSGEAADVILQAPAKTEVGVPLAGKTLTVTFPYRLLDENGDFLLDAENADWSVTGEDTTGLSIDKGVLTVEPAAKAGTYTVTLTVGDKTASQTITLTREASVATQIKICRSGAELTDFDILRIPASGALAYTYMAEVIDQYGVAFEPAVTWSVSGDTTGVSHENGVITLSGGAASGSLTLTATVGEMSASINVVTIEENSIEVQPVSTSATDAVISLRNNSAASVTVQGIIVAYDSNGRMIGCQVVTITLDVGESGELSLSYSAASEVESIRVFVLHSGTYEPLKGVWKQTVSTDTES